MKHIFLASALLFASQAFALVPGAVYETGSAKVRITIVDEEHARLRVDPNHCSYNWKGEREICTRMGSFQRDVELLRSHEEGTLVRYDLVGTQYAVVEDATKPSLLKLIEKPENQSSNIQLMERVK